MVPVNDPTWRKSSYSVNNGQCVEAAGTTTGVLVRDSRNPDGPVLAFSPGEWRRFTAAIKTT